jgi:hypothetical protein
MLPQLSQPTAPWFIWEQNSLTMFASPECSRQFRNELVIAGLRFAFLRQFSHGRDNPRPAHRLQNSGLTSARAVAAGRLVISPT